MKKSVATILDNAKSKMSGYVALLNYRYANLSVLAQAEALLCVFVDLDGDRYPIEKVAKARNAPDREDQFEIYPNDQDLLKPLVKGLNDVHPDYKIELVSVDEENDDDDKFILATVPPVDDARHKLLTEAVDLLAKVCNGQLEETFGASTAQISVKLAEAPKEEQDEAKDALQQIRDEADKIVKKMKGDKEDEIEKAYKLYKEEQDKKKEEQEKKMKDAQAGAQMKMTPGDE